MPPDYIIFIIFIIILIYIYINQNSQIGATASAIRQIFSGGCQLHCRQSGVTDSRFSGLSGLPPGPSQPPTCCAAGGSARAGTSRGCACDTCPCALIDNFLVTCSPAARLYTSVIATIVELYYAVASLVFYARDYTTRVIECGTSCQRQAQIVQTNKNGSVENFAFTDGKEDKPQPATNEKNKSEYIMNLNEVQETTSKLLLLRRKSSTLLNKIVKSKHDDAIKTVDDGSKAVDDNLNNNSSTTLKASDSVSETTSDARRVRSTCPKCREKGKTCIRKCPRQKK